MSSTYTTDIPTQAIDVLKTLDNQGITPNTIAFAPNGGWVIVNGNNGYNTNNIPPEALNKLATLNKQNSTINTSTLR